MVLPFYMASLISKRKKNKLYYYVVESARVNGQPRIIHQTYLGSAEKVAALVKDRTAPLPVSASFRELGLPGALWLAAQDTGVFQVLHSLWPSPRSGPSPAHYLLLAAIHRICRPGRRRRWRIGIRKPSCFPPGAFLPSASPHRLFGTASSKSCPNRRVDFLNGGPDPLEEAQQRCWRYGKTAHW